MRPVSVRGRAIARVRHRPVAIPLLAIAVAAAVSACGDSSTAPGATSPEAREARAFTIAGVTYPTVAIQGANTSLAVGSKESLTTKLATPTATWMGAYMTWTSSNSSVASVAISNRGSANGEVGTVTGVANGTATITATTESGTSASITITVGAVGVVQSSGGYHEPAGMVMQINTGAMTNAPARVANGTWTEGTASFTNWSPNTPNSVGEVATNLSAVPGGSGLRLTYPTNLDGGYSPVRFGTHIAGSGTGHLYIRWKMRFSPNWTLSEAGGVKLMEPRTVNSTENHIIEANSYGLSKDGSSLWPNFALQFSTGSGTLAYFVPGTNGMPDKTSYFASALANIGGSALGTWHTIEYYMMPESPAGNGNGQLTIWVDGSMMFQSGTAGTPPGGMHFFQSGEAMGWNYLQFDPTYGGDQATDHPPYDIYWDIDDLYVSTK
jgi:hypothetical protein